MPGPAPQPIFPPHQDTAPYRRLTGDFVGTASFAGEPVLKVDGAALTTLAQMAFTEVAHLLRPGHLAQLRQILDDPEASDNDRFVAIDLLKNAVVSAAGVLPMCQDTGTAMVYAEKGQRVWTMGDDAACLATGIARAFAERNFRYSQMAPLTMFEEVNTNTNLPAQIDINATAGDTFRFLFIAKGGGSANKTFLYQQTKAILNPDALVAFLDEKIRTLGTAACPPYHLSIAIGGTSAEMTLKTVKLASCRYLDDLPTAGTAAGTAFRDRALEAAILQRTREMGIGAQFGGKYFCHDVRIVRLPRHGGSLPIGIGVSCSADRQVLGRIDAGGVFLEQLETDPASYLPEIDEAALHRDVTAIDLTRPMAEIRAALAGHPVKARLSLTGPLVVARDIAHARLRDDLARGTALPEAFRAHPVYYAGPAKTPAGHATGSFGPTTSARMDGYVAEFQRAGGALVMLGKGNRSAAVVDACKANGGFYLGTVGGPGARLAQDCIKRVEPIAYPELGMEAIFRIEVEDFPAFIVIDDKGNDFFATL